MAMLSVTVLIDTYNYARFLPRAIESVLAQLEGHPHHEILVVDDGSTDETEAVIARYGDRVRYLRKCNGGQASALNLGFREARGDIMCLLDADDFFYPDKIGLVIDAFTLNPNVGLVYNEFDILDSHGNLLPKPYPEPTWGGHCVPLHAVPGQLQDLIALGYPWSTTTSAMAVRTSVVRDLDIPEEVFPHSPDLFLALVLPFMTEVAVVESAQTGYVFHGQNVGLYRASAENQVLFRRQMAHARSYIEERFGRRCITYLGNGLYGAPPPDGGMATRWAVFAKEFAAIRRCNVDPTIKRLSAAKLVASLLLPARVYAAAREGRSTIMRWRHWRRQPSPSTLPPNEVGSSADPARAYDVIAPHYDHEVQGDSWMRALLWKHYDRVFSAGDTILDVGCGTGLDAAHLANRGLKIVAVDISPAMIAQARRRAADLGAGGIIETHLLDIRDLTDLKPAQFDGIISSFAGLSTLPDLDGFAEDSASVLRPGGRLVIHLLNRFSLWEWLELLRRGEWSRAWQLGRRPERIFTIGGLPVDHRMLSRDQAFAAFASRFRLAESYGLGIFRPPHTMHRVSPRIHDALAALDNVLGPHRPFIKWGRFVVLDMVVRSE